MQLPITTVQRRDSFLRIKDELLFKNMRSSSIKDHRNLKDGIWWNPNRWKE